MNNVTDSKQEYIFEWNNYIYGLKPLMLTKDQKLSKEIERILTELINIVPRVADTKTFKDK